MTGRIEREAILSDEPEYLDLMVLAESLAACREQLRRVRVCTAPIDGESTTSPDELALLRTLAGVEELLTRLSETMTTRH